MTTEETTVYVDCSMDGYVALTEELVENALFTITMGVTVVLGLLPADLQMAGCYLYNYLLSQPAFAGYILAAVYYILEDLDYGTTMCTVTQ